jgi:hypothetical protein
MTTGSTWRQSHVITTFEAGLFVQHGSPGRRVDGVEGARWRDASYGGPGTTIDVLA